MRATGPAATGASAGAWLSGRRRRRGPRRRAGARARGRRPAGGARARPPTGWWGSTRWVARRARAASPGRRRRRSPRSGRRPRRGRPRRRSPPGGRAARRRLRASAPGVSTTTATSAAAERGRELAARRIARGDAGLPVDEHDDAVGHERQALARDRPLELALDPPRDEPQRELPERGQVRLGEEPVERDLRPAPAGRRCRASSAGGARAGSCRRARSRRPSSEDLVGEALVDRCAGDRRDRVGDATRGAGRCSVLTTWIPASRMTSTSSQRFVARGARDVRCGRARRPARPSGRRAMMASVSISSTTTPRYSIRRRGTISRPSSSSSVCGPAVGLDEADDEVRAARRRRRWPSSSIR